MNIRREIEKRIEKRQAELDALQKGIAEARAYIQAMHDVLKLHTKEGNSNSIPVRSLREGSDMSKVRDMILKEGRPIHINEILKGLGKDDTVSNRTSVAGSLGSYVRKGKIFTRPAANTFGLIETGEHEHSQEPIPPPTFGIQQRENSSTQKMGA